MLDLEASNSGSLRLAICEDYTALGKVMNFHALEWIAASRNLPSPSSFGFQYFKKQLPLTEIYPVAVLDDIEIDPGKREKGIGRRAIRAFRAVAEEYKSRLGLLRIGTGGTYDVDYASGLDWRRRLYAREGWKCFETPPLGELSLVWMYHLLPPLSPAERVLRNCLVEKPLREYPFGPILLDEKST